VLGILAVLGAFVVFGALLGIVAIGLGVIARGRVKRGEATNGGSALAGIILGVISLLIAAALIAFGVSILSSDNGKKLQDCIRAAGQDQAAQQTCQREFQNNFGK